jgi:rare lipoprotein A
MIRLIFIVLTFNFLQNAHLSAQEFGGASMVGDNFQGKKTASGELYDLNKLTAAHKSYPFGTKIKITRLDNKQSVIVRVNDRGPYIKGRVADLSRKAAREIGLTEGEVKVRIDLVEKANDNEDIRPPKPAPIVEVPEKKATLTAKGDEKKKAAAKKDTKAVVVTPAKETKVPEAKKLNSKEDDAPLLTGKTFKTGELYKMQLLKPERDGFGLQVAAMSDINNVMRKVAELQESFFKNVLVSTEKDAAGKPNYKIILGPFPDVATAESYKKSAKKKKMSGFVINLKTMEKM